MAVRFDATTDRYETTTGLPPTVYTAMCWYYISVDRNAYSLLWELQYNGRTVINSPYITASKAIEVWDGNQFKMTLQGATVGWQRLALAVGTGGDATLYHGTATGALALSSTTTLIGSAATVDKLMIGNDPLDQWFNGRVAAYKMWNATLTQAEIEREFETYQPARTANLLRWHPFINAELVDYSGNGNTLTAGSTATATEDGPPIPWRPARPWLIHVPAVGPPAVEDPPMYLRRVAPARR